MAVRLSVLRTSRTLLPRNIIILMFLVLISLLGGIPVPTAWRVLGLRMEERPPDMEVSCEYIE
jgi:hypothetical protein